MRASLQRAQYFPNQSCFLIPVSEANFCCPSATPLFAAAVRLISLRICTFVMAPRNLNGFTPLWSSFVGQSTPDCWFVGVRNTFYLVLFRLGFRHVVRSHS